MDAVLRPHRSLSASAFKLMLIVVIAANAVLAIVFAAQGALPVAGFLGLDVLVLYLAFRMNYRAAQRVERVCVTRQQIYVSATDADGATTHWLLNPFWARVARDGKGVLVRAGAGQMRIGAFLPPAECDAFAAALSNALWRAKR